MATTTKLDKRDLKTPDEFLTLGSRAAQYVAENAAMVIGGTLVVLLLIAAGFGWIHQQHLREVEASARLFEGDQLLGGSDANARLLGMSFPTTVSDESRRKALEAFEQVAKDYPGSAGARHARLKMGDVRLDLGEYDAAIAEYEQAVPGGSKEDVYYAQNGIGHALEAKQAWDDAAAAYRRVVDDDRQVMRDIATLDLARVLIRAGKNEEARALLSTFGEKFPESSLKDDATKELTKVGGPVPTPAASPASDGSAPPADGGSGSAG